MSRLRWRTLAMSIVTGPVAAPYSAAWCARYETFALQISFLLGRQLTFGHEPPIQRRSTTAVDWPDGARCHARCLPPAPLPTIRFVNDSACGMLSSHLGHSRSQPDPPLESSERMHRQPSPLLRVASSSARATHTRSSPFVSWRHLHAAAFHEERAMRRGEWRSCHVLFQQIYRDGEEDDVLHEERDVTRHGRVPPGRRLPAVRHEG